MLELWIVIVLLVIIGLSMEAKLGRANRIGRATHDLIKEMVDLQKKANTMLQYLNDRAYDAEVRGRKPEDGKDGGHRPPQQKREEPEVYRI